VTAAQARGRTLLVATLALSVLVAGCLGGRRGAPSAGPEAALAGAEADSLPADSTRQADADAAVDADSLVADSLGREALGPDTLAVDTLAIDTLPRPGQDTARTITVPAAKAPTTRECLLDFNESPPDSRMVSNLMSDGTRTTFIGGGLLARCQGDPQFITADSAEQYENIGMLNLIGSVVFEEPGKIRVTAPSATYFTADEKLVAVGGVVATDLPSGSTFTGPTIEYYRAGSRRLASRLYAPQRPTLQLIERDSLGAAKSPITITANEMEDHDDGPLAAWGQVIVTREQIVAEGDTASFDQDTEQARLIRNAVVFSRDTARAFRLVGDTIDLFSTDRVLERVLASHQARATSRDVAIRAERVEMALDSQQVDRAWAYGPGRAFAETGTQALEADSIEILMPGQLVRELHALGRALAFGTPDSSRLRTDERDLLAGDTIVADFDTLTTPPDTATRSVLRLVTATGNASSRSFIPSSRGPDAPPSISYVRGKEIRAHFEDGQMRTVEVDSQAVGLFLEPETDSLAPPPDSVRRPPGDAMPPDSVPPDSAPPVGVPPDSVRPDTTGPRPGRPDTVRLDASAITARTRRAGAWLPSPASGLLAYAVSRRAAFVAPAQRRTAWSRRRSVRPPDPAALR
jgi:hypothetical protein